MARIGLLRIGDDPDDARLQREALAPHCSDIVGEPASRRRLVQNRPELLTALAKVGSDDMLVVSRARRLAQHTDDGLAVLIDIIDRGITVKVLNGIAAGEHTLRSPALDFVRELTRVRHEIQVQQIRAGITAARERGRTHGRPVSIDEEMKRTIRLRHSAGNSMRAIAQEVGVSVGSVHGVLRKA
ncbi:recombinase family protein [Glutamicibacter nicotianae]|uniref:recombinase family protein n=1 Tax=Glutamicibacter nicotianae TaxID=37929 RepID=UPI001141B2ED|nr:recombinase family protein [Glutamicibacter nicotianae]